MQVEVESRNKGPPEEAEKKRKKNTKPKKTKQNVESDKLLKNDSEKEEMHARRIEVKPITSDEDFWDFYEKPFAQS